MKTTLKTFPSPLLSCPDPTWIQTVLKWRDDFEAELRELFKEKSCPVCWRVEYLKKEILGESHG